MQVQMLSENLLKVSSEDNKLEAHRKEHIRA
jgi:hypothetical protein